MAAQQLEPRLVLTPMVALTNRNEIVTFDSEAPETILSSQAVTGLGRRETLVGMDVRPATGEIYAVSKAGNLYTIDAATGAATFRTALVADATDTSAPFKKLTGRTFGVDFNPAVDRLRITTETDFNLRVNVDTGATITDTKLAYAADDVNRRRNPNVSGSAYLNPDNDPSTGTLLYNIDASRRVLVVQNPANDGVLTTVGSLGINFATQVGFDIDQDGTAYATITPKGRGFNGRDTSLYVIDLETGTATSVGEIGDGMTIIGLAIILPTNPVFAVTDSNELVSFNDARPEVLTSRSSITGLSAGESIVGIDFRPATGVLYGLGSTGTLYTIDPDSGAATAAPPLIADPTDATSPFTGFTGTTAGFDFNPVADRLRIVSESDANLRTNVDTGVVITDTPLQFAVGGADPNVVASAYTNSVAGATTTQLFGIDSELDVLVLQNPANNGTLTTIGALGVNVTNVASFDIGANGIAYAAVQLSEDAAFGFYRIDLSTGAATFVGLIGGTTIPGGSRIRGLAVAPLIDNSDPA